MRDVRLHFLLEQTHIIPPPTLLFFHWWVDIVLSINGIRTLVDVFIINPTQVDLVFRVASFYGVAMMLVA
jgi:hypothetical protein